MDVQTERLAPFSPLSLVVNLGNWLEFFQSSLSLLKCFKKFERDGLFVKVTRAAERDILALASRQIQHTVIGYRHRGD